MQPVAITMSVMSFIKHIQSLPDVGQLIDPTKPIADHVPTNHPDYAKHAAAANEMETGADEANARKIPSFGGVASRTRKGRGAATEEGEEEVDAESAKATTPTHMDGATMSTLASIIKSQTVFSFQFGF